MLIVDFASLPPPVVKTFPESYILGKRTSSFGYFTPLRKKFPSPPPIMDKIRKGALTSIHILFFVNQFYRLSCGPIILTMAVATTSTRSLVYSALNCFYLVCSIMRTELKQNSSPPSWQDGRAGNNNLQKLSLAQFSALATSVLRLFNCISWWACNYIS